MLGYTRLSQEPSSLFADPRKKYPALVHLATTIGYVVTCFVKLIPLGNSDHNAKAIRDAAQNDFNDVDNKLKNLENKIQEAKKRVIDLDCAIQGYDLFDQRAYRFLMVVNGSTLPVLDQLNQFLKMQFVADKTTTEEFTRKLSYVKEVEKCKYKYDCWGQAICGEKIDCCNQYICHTDDETYYYDEDSITTNYYSNILQGGPLKLEPLNCGYYSRNFTVNSPTTIKTYESLPSRHGSRESGEIDIYINKEWGSNVKGSCYLDDQNQKLDVNVTRAVSQDFAAANLLGKFSHFLASCVMAFEAVGANYPALQETIRRSIPGLIEEAAAVNITLQEKASVLAEKNEIFSTVHDDFMKGLAIWLPQLIFVPIVMAAFVYVVMTCCRTKKEELWELRIDDGNDSKVSYKTLRTASKPPTYSPRLNFSDVEVNDSSSAEISSHTKTNSFRI